MCSWEVSLAISYLLITKTLKMGLCTPVVKCRYVGRQLRALAIWTGNGVSYVGSREKENERHRTIPQTNVTNSSSGAFFFGVLWFIVSGVCGSQKCLAGVGGIFRCGEHKPDLRLVGSVLGISRPPSFGALSLGPSQLHHKRALGQIRGDGFREEGDDSR